MFSISSNSREDILTTRFHNKIRKIGWDVSDYEIAVRRKEEN